jgi:hypothetical protein
MIMRPSLTAPLIALLAACHAEKPDWAQNAQPAAMPGGACAAVEKVVAQIRTSRGIELADNGEATLPTAAWNMMSADQHDQLVRTIAFHAACKTGAESDAQPVVVRSDDGTELARRTISTRLDPGELMREPSQ